MGDSSPSSSAFEAPAPERMEPPQEQRLPSFSTLFGRDQDEGREERQQALPSLLASQETISTAFSHSSPRHLPAPLHPIDDRAPLRPSYSTMLASSKARSLAHEVHDTKSRNLSGSSRSPQKPRPYYSRSPENVPKSFAQLPGIRDLSLPISGPVAPSQPSSASLDPVQRRSEHQQLLDIFYHLRSENRARGIRPPASEVLPSARLIEQSDSVLQFIVNEFAAIAAREGERVAGRVAKSYGFQARPGVGDPHLSSIETESPLHHAWVWAGHNDPSSSASSSHYVNARSPPSLLGPAPLGHPAHPHHHSRVSAATSSLAISPPSWSRRPQSPSAEKRQVLDGSQHQSGYTTAPPSALYGPHGSIRPPVYSQFSSGDYYSGASAVEGGSSNDSGSDPLRGQSTTAGPSRRSKARRRVTKREGEVPTCLGCGRASTAEWRRGPTGPRTLCNACGLLFAKLSRLKKNIDGGIRAPEIDPWTSLEELRAALRTSSKGSLSLGSNSMANNQHIIGVGSSSSNNNQHQTGDGPSSNHSGSHPSSSLDWRRGGESSSDSSGHHHHHHRQNHPHYISSPPLLPSGLAVGPSSASSRRSDSPATLRGEYNDIPTPPEGS